MSLVNLASHAPILLVEDEKNLGITLSEYLKGLGYNCQLAINAAEGQKYFDEMNPAIVLLDIGLPDGNGLELARKWRRQKKDFVLLFLSALNDPSTRLEGLEIGAEDYITKPFALKELILRLERILSSRNRMNETPEELQFGPLKIWFKRYEVQDAFGNIISLAQKECAILNLLYERREEAVTRDEMIDLIWGTDKYPSQRTVDNYIVRLRKWTETDKEGHLNIQSIRAIGYKLSLK